jgi:preprotein translocase subunit SecF
MLRIFHNTSYDFNRWWKVALIVTFAFLAVGVVALATRGIQYNIEFTGGTLKQLEFTKDVDPGFIRETLDKAGFHDAEIQEFGSKREFTIRVAGEDDLAAQDDGAELISAQVDSVLTAAFGEGNVTVLRTEAVGPRVGKELRGKALIAIMISFVIVLIYLAVRFEWRFGLAAIIGTAHDMAATIAFLAIMNIEVSLTIVAALLTVLGYSLNDTIIIFDRVRENMKKGRDETLYQILNRSINETLPRSIMTHATVTAATVALLLFAGEVIRPFSWVMLFGIIVSVFSSTYIAGPALMWIEEKFPREQSPWKHSSTATRTSQTQPSKMTAAR